jgi:DNA (cytosine-5)-methyltransferase 1
MEIVGKLRPRAVMFENVRGFAAKKFESYRRSLISDLSKLGYTAEWKVLQAADFGVPQLRPRFILVALNSKDWEFFEWPIPGSSFPSVGDTLIDLMEENGWKGAKTWAKKAQGIAPTIVGGSKKHGGPDLGPTRAKRQWKEMGVDGMGIANEAPPRMYPKNDLPRLTVRMAARIQSFPDEWEFAGKKTVAYRQVGNAFPPLVACALGLAIRNAFLKKRVLRRDALEPTQMRLLEGNREKKKYGGKKRIKAANSRVPASK